MDTARSERSSSLPAKPDARRPPAVESEARGHSWPALRPLLKRLKGTRGFDVRLAHSAEHEHAVSTLVRRRYAWRGYNTEALAPRGDEASRVTVGAWQSNELAATLTVRRDDGEALQNDALYAAEIARLRAPGRVIGEVSRLAVDPHFSCPELLLELFRAALRYARDILKTSDLVIGVNPRHVGYYERRLGFRQIGQQKQCERVAAPVVLLHCTLDDLALIIGGVTASLAVGLASGVSAL